LGVVEDRVEVFFGNQVGLNLQFGIVCRDSRVYNE